MLATVQLSHKVTRAHELHMSHSWVVLKLLVSCARVICKLHMHCTHSILVSLAQLLNWLILVNLLWLPLCCLFYRYNQQSTLTNSLTSGSRLCKMWMKDQQLLENNYEHLFTSTSVTLFNFFSQKTFLGLEWRPAGLIHYAYQHSSTSGYVVFTWLTISYELYT